MVYEIVRSPVFCCPTDEFRASSTHGHTHVVWLMYYSLRTYGMTEKLPIDTRYRSSQNVMVFCATSTVSISVLVDAISVM